MGKKKRGKVMVGTDGPRTRYRASKMTLPTDKQVNIVEDEVGTIGFASEFVYFVYKNKN